MDLKLPGRILSQKPLSYIFSGSQIKCEAVLSLCCTALIGDAGTACHFTRAPLFPGTDQSTFSCIFSLLPATPCSSEVTVSSALV